jgi:predicted Rdx family selenoprotein
MVEVMPGGRGDFRVSVDGALLWDKKNREHDFPDDTAFVADLARTREGR